MRGESLPGRAGEAGGRCGRVGAVATGDAARRIELDRDRKARDARVEDAAARVYAGMAARDVAIENVAVTESRIAEALGALTAEGLSIGQISELCELTTAEIL